MQNSGLAPSSQQRQTPSMELAVQNVERYLEQAIRKVQRDLPDLSQEATAALAGSFIQACAIDYNAQVRSFDQLNLTDTLGGIGQNLGGRTLTGEQQHRPSA